MPKLLTSSAPTTGVAPPATPVKVTTGLVWLTTAAIFCQAIIAGQFVSQEGKDGWITVHGVVADASWVLSLVTVGYAFVTLRRHFPVLVRLAGALFAVTLLQTGIGHLITDSGVDWLIAVHVPLAFVVFVPRRPPRSPRGQKAAFLSRLVPPVAHRGYGWPRGWRQTSGRAAASHAIYGMTARWGCDASALQCESSSQVQQQREGLAHLAEKHRADISCPLVYPSGGDGAHMLALRRRPRLKTIELVEVDDHLGATLANGAGQGHHLNDVGPTAQDSLRRHHDSRPTESSLAATGHPEVEVDNVTRRQHQARRSHRQLARLRGLEPWCLDGGRGWPGSPSHRWSRGARWPIGSPMRGSLC